MTYIKLFVFSVVLTALGTQCIAQVSDDFEDGDFTGNPTWTGITGHFEVNSSNQLHLNNTAPTGADISHLTTTFSSISLDSKEWQFWIKHSLSGSSNNYGRFWLVSSESDPTSASNQGYFLQFGESGSNDAIELFYSNAGVNTSVCRGTDGLIAGSFEMRIRVRRDGAGLWSIDIDDNSGYDFIPHASGSNNALATSSNLGMVCVYTSSNAANFYYDDIYFGDYILDVTPPTLVSVTVTSSSTLDVLFSEPVTQASAELLTNYSADGGLNNPNSATLDGNNTALVHLQFAGTFANGTTYQLAVSGIQDASGNTISTVSEPFVYVVTVPANYRDVVINEFMADPTPIVNLAEAEFVELYNTSTNYIDISGWKLGDASGFGTVGSHIIGPGEFALLVSTTNAPLFAFYQNVVTVTSFPSFNNDGDQIIIADASEVVIDQLEYDMTWYGDETKEDGGYSIEQINPFASCANASNWRASIDPNGGTPVTVNSVFDPSPDVIGPNLIGVEILGTQTVQVYLNEALSVGGISASNISVEPGISVVSAAAVGPANSSLVVSFGNPIDTGVVYTLTITGIADCEGNLQGADSVETFMLPFNADSGDFVINEVLFNPYTGGSDYVELVNVTDRPLNLKGWLLASFDDEDGISSLRVITGLNYAVPAGGYVLITEDTANVTMNYITHGIGNFIEANMPSYNNDSGTVYLLTIDSLVSERFAYDDEMHFPLLDDVDGVSLERLDVARSVNDKGNWHSAAQSFGFGTPGLQNSQYFPTGEAVGEVSMEPEIFSPDNDGLNDVLNINYRFTEPGFVATVRIYDANGRPMRLLSSNELLATTGTMTWDGTTDDGEKARIGMYIIFFEAFSTSGAKSVHKLSTVLGGKL